MGGQVESRRTNNSVIDRFEENSPRGKRQWNWRSVNDKKSLEMIVPLRQEQGTDELLKDRKKLTDLGEKRYNKEFIDILWVHIMLRANHVSLIETTHILRNQCITSFE